VVMPQGATVTLLHNPVVAHCASNPWMHRGCASPRMNSSVILVTITEDISGNHTRVSFTNASFNMGRISLAFLPTFYLVGLPGLKDGLFLPWNSPFTIQRFNPIELIQLIPHLILSHHVLVTRLRVFWIYYWIY
jgi:hypothetical protein